MNTFWLNDPSVLFKEIPHNITFIDKLNIIFLISIIISIILVLINNFDLSYLALTIIVGIITFIIYEHKYVYNLENFDSKCIMSSVNNPFMNPNIIDTKYSKPCDINNTILNKNFYTNTFRDVNDFYERSLSVRQFYTVPAKTIPNDRDSLAQWLYNTNNNKKSCKQGNHSRCLKNINLDRNDLRYVGQFSS